MRVVSSCPSRKLNKETGRGDRQRHAQKLPKYGVLQLKRRVDWSGELLSLALGAASRVLMLRDMLLGVTRGLRCHPLAETFFFASGQRKLAATFVPGEPMSPAMLLCHGIGETVEHWSAAQALLRDQGVGSMVFNYSGYGRSTGCVSAKNCDADFVAAYAELRRRVGDDLPIYVLGFSLGSGIAAQGVATLHPPAAGLFLCEAFDSFHEAAFAAGVPRWIVRKVPDVWKTTATIPQLLLPVCVVHSTGDKLFPLTMPQKIVAASSGRAELVVIENLAHNEPFLKTVERYWEPIIQRVLSPTRIMPY